ncbi:MAG: peptidylprolyl isomerase [Spirochaetales bacterium]|uniref:Peptidylprolyl isomerase n=1 Tax=Candidatus Thalassospirochaeta sargassi TaxID=3119039 RepID=A0AAJ1IE00_9SPIO|nr:peptidylprolyl isomerase [Spirochaetales bacterium]
MTNKLFKILLITMMLFPAVFAVAQDEPDSTVAEVNGSTISSLDVKREMNMMYQQAVSQGVYPDNSEIEAYWNQALETLIGRELLHQAAVAKDYEADSEAIDQYISGLTANYGGTEKLEAALSEQGITLERLRRDTERYYILSEFVDKELRTGISVSDEESLAYYNDNSEYFVQEETIRASHILLKIAEDADDEVKAEKLAEIEAIRERITAGEDFAELAKEYSDCPSSEQGGDLGDFGHGMMVPPFDRAAFALEVGELSEPVLTQFGYHLILLTDKKEGEIISYESVKDQIQSYLADVRLDTEVGMYVAELRDSADIKLF